MGLADPAAGHRPLGHRPPTRVWESFYRSLPGLPIAQVVFLAGLTMAVLAAGGRDRWP